MMSTSDSIEDIRLNSNIKRPEWQYSVVEAIINYNISHLQMQQGAWRAVCPTVMRMHKEVDII